MKTFNASFTAFLLLLATTAIAQPCFTLSLFSASAKAKEVMQDNEFTQKGKANDNYFCNPLVLNGQPLNYEIFNLNTKGELTLIKRGNGPAGVIEIPFHVYLRRNGTLIKLTDDKIFSTSHLKIEISEILKFAKGGDQLIIEPANKEDWAAKRILKLLDDGC